MEADTRSESLSENAQSNEQPVKPSFIVIGIISFTPMTGFRLDSKNVQDKLKELTAQVDQQHPWISRWTEGGHDRASSRSSCSGAMRIPDMDCGVYEVRIWSASRVKESQYHAYSKYLSCLAENLAKMNIEGIAFVSSGIQVFSGDQGFTTPAYRLLLTFPN